MPVSGTPELTHSRLVKKIQLYLKIGFARSMPFASERDSVVFPQTHRGK